MYVGGAGVCVGCGCTEEDCSQCVELTGSPCTWVAPDLCSACAEQLASPLVQELLGYASKAACCCVRPVPKCVPCRARAIKRLHRRAVADEASSS